MMNNTGQSCNAPSRMLVPRKHLAKVEAIAAAVASQVVVGDPGDPKSDMGPQANQNQWRKVQGLIEKGIKEGAKVVCGGAGPARAASRAATTRSPRSSATSATT